MTRINRFLFDAESRSGPPERFSHAVERLADGDLPADTTLDEDEVIEETTIVHQTPATTTHVSHQPRVIEEEVIVSDEPL